MPHTFATPPAPALAGPRTALAVSIRWAISPTALTASSAPSARELCAPGLPAGAALVWEIAATRASARLVAVAGDAGERSVSVVCGSEALERTSNASNPQLAVRHIEVDGLLRIAIRRDQPGQSGGDGELLYAWTSILADRLGLPGGVYDAPSLRIG